VFSLQRVYAFAVTPQRGVADEDQIDPNGGPVALTPALREVIENAFAKIARGVLTTVDFEFDGDRSNAVRDDVMAVAFGATQTPRAAAARLATRLAQTMDNRSHAALLVLVVEADDPKRRVSLLVLPREDVIQLGRQADEVLLNLLRDAFSTGSGLRKLARLEGHQSRTQFLSAEVLDLQLASAHRTTADFWIRNFLEAKPRIDSQTGTRQLAAALQRAFDAASEDDRDAVFAAIFKASSGTVQRTSLTKVADEVPQSLHPAFFRGVPNEEMSRAVFVIDRSVMKDSLARRVITGSDGVVISAPAETVGKSVELKSRGQLRVVSYTGTVEKEQIMRNRRGAQTAESQEVRRERGKRSKP
jgi:hypothetical protein